MSLVKRSPKTVVENETPKPTAADLMEIIREKIDNFHAGMASHEIQDLAFALKEFLNELEKMFPTPKLIELED